MRPAERLREDSGIRELLVVVGNPKVTQRQMAAELETCLGATHNIPQALVKRGWARVERFSAHIHNEACAYALIFLGIAEKSEIAVRLLVRKREDYEELGLEIDELHAVLTRKTPHRLIKLIVRRTVTDRHCFSVCVIGGV